MRGYVEASSANGVDYSTNEGQIGQGNIGRTAAAGLGYRLIGEGKSKVAREPLDGERFGREPRRCPDDPGGVLAAHLEQDASANLKAS